MKTNIIDGKLLSEKILDSVKEKLGVFPERPRLAVVAFGDDSAPYIQQKRRAAEQVGVEFRSYVFPVSLGSGEARRALNEVSRESHAHSIIVQLPLPEQVGSAILNVIAPEKDPDVLSDRSIGLFFNGRLPVKPPTAEAVLSILEDGKVSLSGKTVSVFGHGHLVGKFLTPLLLRERAVVRVVAHRLNEKDIASFAAGSDIVVSATGDAHFLDPALLPEGAVVIDAGFSTLDGQIRGDIDFAKAPDRFSLISPVPGGVGPVGVANLFKNIATLYALQTH